MITIGLLGDPAKKELYSKIYYDLIGTYGSKEHEAPFAYALLGASERDVTKIDYEKMYSSFQKNNLKKKFTYQKQFIGEERLPRILKAINRKKIQAKKDVGARIGLFPSSARHIINGPSFILAPIPINTLKAKYYYKAYFLSSLLRNIKLEYQIINLAYHPLGGKAAERTQASSLLKKTSIEKMASNFYQARKSGMFDWYYIEAGSGEHSLSRTELEELLWSQLAYVKGATFKEYRSGMFKKNMIKKLEEVSLNKITIQVPNVLYGGGIKSKEIFQMLMDTQWEESGTVRLVPSSIVVGNLSEDDVTETEKICQEMEKFNKEIRKPVTN
ncbi:MAG: hypothetical protein ACTSYA_05785 [Candidatus Kariarchaeaceae archaeon]